MRCMNCKRDFQQGRLTLAALIVFFVLKTV